MAGTGALRLIFIIGQGSFGIVHKAMWRGSLVDHQIGIERSDLVSRLALPKGGTLSVTREIETCK